MLRYSVATNSSGYRLYKMSKFKPKTPDYNDRLRASFDRMAMMQTLGATLGSVDPGLVQLDLEFATKLTQQHGFLHAGVASTLMDTACGYAAATLMPADTGVLTIEFKVNLLAPGLGKRFRFVGRVIKPGRTISVCDGQAFGMQDGKEKLFATMTATMMTVADRADIKG